jgi:hypothetical protein
MAARYIGCRTFAYGPSVKSGVSGPWEYALTEPGTPSNPSIAFIGTPSKNKYAQKRKITEPAKWTVPGKARENPGTGRWSQHMASQVITVIVI